jgi:hypothetical protein
MPGSTLGRPSSLTPVARNTVFLPSDYRHRMCKAEQGLHCLNSRFTTTENRHSCGIFWDSEALNPIEFSTNRTTTHNVYISRYKYYIRYTCKFITDNTNFPRHVTSMKVPKLKVQITYLTPVTTTPSSISLPNSQDDHVTILATK